MSDPYAGDPWAVSEPDNIPDYRQQPPDDAPPTDPWASASTADEAQSNIPAPRQTKESYVSNGTSEGKIVTTIKYGAGFDAPWTVIHSDSIEEAERSLNEAKNLLELTAKVARFAKTLDSGTAPAGQRGNGNGGGQRQQQSTPPGVETKTCAHGEMTYRTGNSAKGPWAGYFCPLEKGNPDQCKAVFVRNK
ncbi:hypothetical protein [Nonomuraea jabiensis]|uniref:hypothetical protein n=1 Tax=Nonomuraea jabiensis TaxID=882448 RepID=UPI003D71493A